MEPRGGGDLLHNSRALRIYTAEDEMRIPASNKMLLYEVQFVSRNTEKLPGGIYGH